MWVSVVHTGISPDVGCCLWESVKIFVCLFHQDALICFHTVAKVYCQLSSFSRKSVVFKMCSKFPKAGRSMFLHRCLRSPSKVKVESSQVLNREAACVLVSSIEHVANWTMTCLSSIVGSRSPSHGMCGKLCKGMSPSNHSSCWDKLRKPAPGPWDAFVLFLMIRHMVTISVFWLASWGDAVLSCAVWWKVELDERGRKRFAWERVSEELRACLWSGHFQRPQ